MKRHVRKRALPKWAIAAVAALALAFSGGSIAAEQRDIVHTAASAGQFKTLVAALNAAGLVDTLKGPGPFTVFAPTDDAFAKLPAGTLESLLKPENKAKLKAILTYHVVPGTVPSTEVVKMKEAPTVNGKPLTISAGGGHVMINAANVVTPDIPASNGVIHVVDSVILPPNG
jgi:uncharacterized surface protein with fasciclin (FAS1) repeats